MCPATAAAAVVEVFVIRVWCSCCCIPACFLPILLPAVVAVERVLYVFSVFTRRPAVRSYTAVVVVAGSMFFTKYMYSDVFLCVVVVVVRILRICIREAEL